MTPVEKHLLDAVADRNADAVRSMLLERTFVVISITSSAGDKEQEQVSTLRAEVEDFEALVAFTSEARANDFVEEMEELFEEEDEVEGVCVDGDALLDSLSDGLGLLVNPEDEGTAVIDPDLAKLVVN